ncbi:UDP-glucose dehydrogenase/UDP-mannac dehydrogenase, putative [Metarhizium acridum CQMa 102]|uniref:UDP-glucose dehydrogenase/UDP-mannac dehydrogenase, putative n=1 Tax=Metarhizium acridum (strain CQMa 102) TaxID=655827 RepID=E9E3J6_METAQ|nr:UDP-glucose dehydrogenase/UDP-mannac dehydrogenase, putative [Metarhizium acridum CQMa 102]EFY89589.1 UDP-glucose dehydrogenase/UDP-mannac dehydrogenase, putative [Metarhizium acridum CQMa 102]
MMKDTISTPFELESSSFQTPAAVVSEGITSFDFDNRIHYDLTPPGEKAEPEQEVFPITDPVSVTTQPLVAIIGVGYVGHHLAQVFSRAYNVLGYDISESRTRHLKKTFESNSRVRFSSSPSEMSQATHFLISVPTLLLPDKRIDSSFLRNALSTVARIARPGSTVIIESSVAVGMTREYLGPLARKNGLFAGMSPERVDPGRTEPPAHAIPKIISGLDDEVPGSLAAIHKLYSRVFDQVTPVSSPEVAEMTKLYENCQRMVCIAYANEMADACISHGINPFEVCNAAATKPFGYIPLMPGLGVGGHCIPVNPYYLLSNNSFPILQAASEKMVCRPREIAERVVTRLCRRLPFCRPRILVVGMGFKPGQAHLINSPGLELARNLILANKVEVSWVDPLVSQDSIPQIPRFDEKDWSVASLDVSFELIIVAFRHSGLDFELLGKLRNVEVDMWCP